MKLFISIFLIFFQVYAFAQQLEVHKLSLKDLSLLKKELSNIKIITIGESSHFDGNVFEFRTEIIKYLHYELGFNTIAFESGIYDLYKVKNEIETKGEPLETSLRKALMKHWANALEFNSFFKFLNETKKINLFGFDPQFSGQYSEEEFVEDFKNYCKKNKIEYKTNKNLISAIESIIFDFKFDEHIIPYEEFIKIMATILTKIKELPHDENRFYWSNIIESILSLAKDVYLIPIEPKTPLVLNIADAIRDKRMAENLLSYIKANPTEKIICIGANAHFIKDLSGFSEPSLKNVKPMGSYLSEKLGNKLYSLALITACKKKNTVHFESNSIENFILNNKEEHLFINTNQEKLKKPLKNNFLGDGKPVKSQINNMFDGLISFKECNPYTEKTRFEEKTRMLKGKIINKKTSQPLVYATVMTLDSIYGAYVNEKGFYNLKLPEDKKVSELIVNIYGYKNIIVPVKELIEVNLIEKVEILDEIVVESRKTARQIVEKAIKNIGNNYVKDEYLVEQLCEGIWKEKDSTYFHFKFTASENSKSINSAFELKKIEIIKGNDTIQKIKNFPFRSRPLEYPILSKRKSKKFDFKYEKDSIINGEEVYKITFSTSKKIKVFTYNLSLSDYIGNLYISKNTYAIIQLNHFWDMRFYDDELMLKQWYIPKEKDFNRKINFIKQTFLFKKEKNANRYFKAKATLEYSGENKKHTLNTIIINDWIKSVKK